MQPLRSLHHSVCPFRARGVTTHVGHNLSRGEKKTKKKRAHSEHAYNTRPHTFVLYCNSWTHPLVLSNYHWREISRMPYRVQVVTPAEEEAWARSTKLVSVTLMECNDLRPRREAAIKKVVDGRSMSVVCKVKIGKPGRCVCDVFVCDLCLVSCDL
jgi:hypothetical protein